MPFPEFVFSYVSEVHQICIYIYVCRSTLFSFVSLFMSISDLVGIAV